jgi:hypothetical protein
MLESCNDIEFLREHMAESILATIVSLILIIGPFVVLWFNPDLGSKMVNDLGFIQGLCFLVLIFRTKDIAPAHKRIKELEASKSNEVM